MTSQVEYLNSQAQQLFFTNDSSYAAIVRTETGTVRGEYSQRIIEKLASAFFEAAEVTERGAEA